MALDHLPCLEGGVAEAAGGVARARAGAAAAACTAAARREEATSTTQTRVAQWRMPPKTTAYTWKGRLVGSG